MSKWVTLTDIKKATWYHWEATTPYVSSAESPLAESTKAYFRAVRKLFLSFPKSASTQRSVIFSSLLSLKRVSLKPSHSSLSLRNRLPLHSFWFSFSLSPPVNKANRVPNDTIVEEKTHDWPPGGAKNCAYPIR